MTAIIARLANVLGSLRKLPFDRANHPSTRDSDRSWWTVYADVASPRFPEEYKAWSSRRKAFKIRYKPPPYASNRSLVSVSGYGVELALKKTDYIVIDDRNGEQTLESKEEISAEVNLDLEDVADVKPLSSSELADLGVKAASFVMSSDDPLDTLDKVLKDFPKHAAALSNHMISSSFVEEHQHNRAISTLR